MLDGTFSLTKHRTCNLPLQRTDSFIMFPYSDFSDKPQARRINSLAIFIIRTTSSRSVVSDLNPKE
jgi:hypothetical protein